MKITSFGIGAVMVVAALAAGTVWAQQGMRHGMAGGGMGHGMGHGMGGSMPMLNGLDTDPQEVDDMRVMFRRHPEIRRSVTNLPDGIVTVTESDDRDVGAAIVSHVVAMIGRVEDNRDPQVPIQSPTLDILFANRALIRTEIEPTETGVRVTQRSDDPATVAALQLHAAEVSDMALRGMRAVHEALMQR